MTDRVVDVKVIAATQRPLLAQIDAGAFRADLYHRLVVVVLELPSLRQREADVVLLAQHFLQHYATAHRMPAQRLSDDAERWLCQCPWPGNVRQLSHLMERIVLFSATAVVNAATLEHLYRPQGTSPAKPPAPPRPPSETSCDEATRVQQALVRTGGNVVRAARLLGISRNAMRHRMRKYGLARLSLEDMTALPVSVAFPGGQDESSPHAPSVLAGAELRPDWEQKPVVVLIVTLKFPQAVMLAESVEEPWTVVSYWERLIVEKVQGFGGIVMQWSPSLLMITFGIPHALEQMPQRAVQAALAIRQAALEARAGTTAIAVPEIRLTLHGGTMLSNVQATDVTTRWLAIADVITYPLQLLGCTAPGEILVSSALASQLAGGCMLQARDVPLTVGREGVQVYTVLGVQPLALAVTPMPSRVLPRFVGREHELAMLHELLDQGTHRQGRALGIVGALGVGKSRLLYEFGQSLGSRKVLALEGHCVSYGSAVPYLPVRDWLRQLCGVIAGESAENSMAKVCVTLENVNMTPVEQAPYLWQLLGLPEGDRALAGRSPEAIRIQTFATVRQLLCAASYQCPLIVVIEDLQWIDKTSEGFLTTLVEHLPGTAVLFLATYRPVYRPPWIERSYVTQLSLQPLTLPDSQHLIQTILAGRRATASLRRDILDRAEGNPFFLAELARTVLEANDTPARLSVPNTVQGALMARIDSLPAVSKRLLQTAATLGRTIPNTLLSMVWDSQTAIAQPLAELQRREFLYAQSGPADTLYHFVHALTYEVAYDSVPLLHRQALHAAAGAALEHLYRQGVDEVTEQLAYHYARSGQPVQAVHYLARIAARAVRTYAHPEAVAALQEALQHAEHLPEAERQRCRLDLSLRLAFSLSMLGRFQAVLDLLLPQQASLEAVHAAALAGPYHFRVGLTYTYLSDYDHAAQHAQRAIAYAQEHQDTVTMGQAYHVLAFISYWMGPPQQGVVYARRAVALLEGTTQQHWLGLAQWALSVNSCFVGDFATALAAASEADAIAQATGDPRLHGFAAWATGWIHSTRGEWEAGMQSCQRAVDAAADPVNTAVALGCLGEAYVEKGDVFQAIPILEQALRQLEQLRLRPTMGRFQAILSEAMLMAGDLDKAQILVQQSLQTGVQANYWYAIGLAHRAAGRIALQRGDFVKATRCFGAACQTFLAMDASFEVARVQLRQAELAYAQNDAAMAAATLHEAHRVFKALQVPRYVEYAITLATRCGMALCTA